MKRHNTEEWPLVTPASIQLLGSPEEEVEETLAIVKGR